MDKSIGFRRNIYLHWMDAAAAFCADGDDLEQVRSQLDPIVAEQIQSTENRRMALDILLNIWGKSRETTPDLHQKATSLYAQSMTQEDRIWLHYGMSLLTYDFFRLGASIIGDLSRFSETITPKQVKERVMAEMGQLGALEKATERIIFSLRNWGILDETETNGLYRPRRRQLHASNNGLEEWILAVLLTTSQAEEIPFEDLLRQPELFPYHFTITLDDIRRSSLVEVQRQGLNWHMVRLPSA